MDERVLINIIMSFTNNSLTTTTRQSSSFYDHCRFVTDFVERESIKSSMYTVYNDASFSKMGNGEQREGDGQ